MRFAFLLLLCACGGRIEGATTSSPDASALITCGDTTCSTSTEFCLEVSGDAAFTQSCTPLPPSCHTCDCAKTPSLAMVCVCSSTGDAIDVSCKGL